jgi:hypothetical protein
LAGGVDDFLIAVNFGDDFFLNFERRKGDFEF